MSSYLHKVDDIWRARNGAAALALENSHHNYQIHNHGEGGGAGLGLSGTLRWRMVRHSPPSSPGGAGSLKEASHGAATMKGRSARQAKEDQARSNRGVIEDDFQ